jgi:hypothetical protein
LLHEVRVAEPSASVAKPIKNSFFIISSLNKSKQSTEHLQYDM